ncbi:hypothetical protein HPT25_25755 [Bacillus sp. BRMEA1]|uniref:hypothetical protein n=1 Tax=Neobacillus endophyticus TaxID=2738405 RepID=UPI00156458EF|nr:hypothetical protein [Neobacillus endophyticus]NRD80737.1 hypothetical protein [Neobacillus endophyticus]
MLQNHNGFFLLELLLSLSALFMICLFFIPIYIDLNEQYRKFEIEKKAHELMYEELEANLMGGQKLSEYTFLENGVIYRIYWRDSKIAGQKEVCVSFEQNSKLAKTDICTASE